MGRQAGFIAIALLLGVVIGVYADRNGDPTEDPSPELSGSLQLASGSSGDGGARDLGAVLDTLTAVLDREVAERARLGGEIEELRLRLDELEDNLASRVSQAFETQRQAGEVTGSARGASSDQAQSRSERLLAAGITPEQMAAISRRVDEVQMERLYLRDRATREGWVGTPRYREELGRLTQSEVLREEMGAEAYDRYLYAMGQPNALTVMGVLQTSAAEKAGLQPGDVLLSYAGERLFSVQQLGDATRGGANGEMITVEVLRGERRMQFSVPRGPLGVSASQQGQVDPDG